MHEDTGIFPDVGVSTFCNLQRRLDLMLEYKDLIGAVRFSYVPLHLRYDVIPGAGEVSLLTAHLCDPHVCRSRLLCRFDGREAGRPEISEARLQIPVHPGSETLRRAIRGNIVSFP